MSTSQVEIEIPTALSLEFGQDFFDVHLSDGRSVKTPISWFPRLFHGSESERKNWRLIGGGAGIHWEDLDEDISTEGLICGKKSMESQKSLAKWLASRSGKNVNLD